METDIKFAARETPMHTPGPWRIVKAKANETRGAPEEAEIRGGNYVVVRLGKHFQAADARLIAAAPDMLAALLEATARLEQHQRDGTTFEEVAATLDEVRAAIAKATGNA